MAAYICHYLPSGIAWSVLGFLFGLLTGWFRWGKQSD